MRRPRKLAVAVAAVVVAVVVVTIAGPCGAEQLHDAAAAGGYKAVQLSDPEDEAESLERPKLKFAVFLLLQEGAVLLNE